jgi:Ca2+-transporting ATPase
MSWSDIILTGLSLAFATIPEELPILIKAVLAVGSLKLSKRNLLIKNLHAAEGLGTVTTILTDKTGTLTENRLRVVSVLTPIKTFGSTQLTEVTPEIRSVLQTWYP